MNKKLAYQIGNNKKLNLQNVYLSVKIVRAFTDMIHNTTSGHKIALLMQCIKSITNTNSPFTGEAML
jgi:hypothetical protein